MAFLHTIVFKVEPSAPKVDLPKDEIYTTIGSADNKSGYLRKICSFENETAQTLRDGHETRLPENMQKALWTGDVYDIDWDAFQLTNNYFCVMLLDGDAYIGHVYVWASDDTLKMQGIRSSINNLLTKQVRGVSTYLVDQVKAYAKDNGFKYVRVIEPIYRMPGILKDMGFKKIVPYDVYEDRSGYNFDYQFIIEQ
jgi:hypothetical protein